jgi:hypothetical protein
VLLHHEELAIAGRCSHCLLHLRAGLRSGPEIPLPKITFKRCVLRIFLLSSC